MQGSKVVSKSALKVYVRMHDGVRLVGAFYLAPGERLQDIMNDDRSFIPLYLDDTKEHNPVVMISKRYVQQVEEIKDNRDTSQTKQTYDKPMSFTLADDVTASKSLNNLELE
jgi:hypothetical protein